MSIFNKLFVPVLFNILFVLSFSNITIASDSSLYPQVDTSQTKGDSCVRPRAEIRKVHPDLLKHDRINTMRLGIRSQADGKSLDGSLKACINCHAIKQDDGKYVRIDNKKHFCSSCHIYAGVSFDCFQCHRDIPEK
ncbi:MAG: hypothetical protein QM479_06635 [Pseudomonadota bacterium]